MISRQHLTIYWQIYLSCNISKFGDSADVLGKINDSVGVAPFVIVPRDNLVEVGVEGDTCMHIEDRRVWVVVDVR